MSAVSFGPPPGRPTPPPEERAAGAQELRFGVLRRGWTAEAFVERPAGVDAGAAVEAARPADPDLVVEPARAGAPGVPEGAALRVVLHAARPGPYRSQFVYRAGGEERAVVVRATVLRPRDGKPGVRANVRVLSRADGEAASDDETDWKGF